MAGAEARRSVAVPDRQQALREVPAGSRASPLRRGRTEGSMAGRPENPSGVDRDRQEAADPAGGRGSARDADRGRPAGALLRSHEARAPEAPPKIAGILLDVADADGMAQRLDAVGPGRDELLGHEALVARLEDRAHDRGIVQLLRVVELA